MSNDFAEEFSRNVQRAVVQQPKKPKKWLIPAVITLVIITLIAIITILIFPLRRTEPADPGVDKLGDITEVEEKLNAEYLKAVENTPYQNYESERKDTAFSSFTPAQICNYFGTPCRFLSRPKELPNFEAIETLNSNSLDYYLDNEKIVIMVATYTDSVSSEPYPFVIYARTGGLYYVFDPNSEYSVYMTKSELFDDIIGIPSFYAMKRGADGN